MRLFLITLLLPVMALADAVIFSGNDVKALKQNLDLFGVAKVMSGNVDPSAGAGVAAPQGSIYLSTTAGLFEKTGALATNWTKVGLLPIDLTTDVTGILPVANGGTGLDGSSAANGSLLIGNGTGYTLSTLTGTANQVSVTNGAGSITLALPQDIATTSTPTFDDVTLGDFDNIKAGDSLAMVLSTGLRSGGVLSINVDPTKADIASGSGYIVDYSTPGTPQVNEISFGPFSAVTITNLASADFTWIMIDSTGSVVQQTTVPTVIQRRQNIVLGRLNHSNRTSITFANTLPDFEFSPISQFGDLVDALGPFNIQGNNISANGANLSMNKSAGVIFQKSYNYSSSTNSPHNVTTPGLTALSFAYQNQSGAAGSSVTVLDPTTYDLAGTTTTVPASNNATVQRVYLFGSNSIRVQRGQQVYPSFANALQDYTQETFVESPLISGFAVPIAYIVITKSCTSLQNTTCSKIIPAAKFGGSVSGSSGGTTTLQQAYNNSVQPQITLDATQLGLEVRDASTPIGSTLFAIQNNAGSTNYLGVDVNGLSTTNFVGTGTTGAVRVHNLTTTQKNALTPALGMMVYDTDIARLECYDGAWGPCTREVQSSDLTLTAGDQIAITLFKNQTYRVAGNTSNAIITIDDTPFGTSAPADGLEITLIASDTDQPIELIYADVAKGCLLNGDALLTYGRSITLKYNSTMDRWIEKARNF